MNMKDIRVATILDECRIVINAGIVDGIENGTRIVLYEIGKDITDPITKENLGKLEIVKGSGIVTHVQERIATVESNMKKDGTRTIRRKDPYSAALTSFLSVMQPYEVIEELSKETMPFENPMPGDYVRVTRK